MLFKLLVALKVAVWHTFHEKLHVLILKSETHFKPFGFICEENVWVRSISNCSIQGNTERKSREFSY